MLFSKVISKISWQDIVLLCIILYYIIIQQNLIAGFKSLPSPIYGGDYYFQLGSIIHIIQGGNILEAPNILNSEPCYFILYSLLVAVFSVVFNLLPISAIFSFSYVLIVISLLLFYFFVFYLFKDKTLSLLGTIIFLPITAFPIMKYTDFTAILMIPLFFFSMFYFFNKRNVKSALIAGIAMGLCNISHSAAFFVTALFLFLMFFYFSIIKHISFDFKTKSIKISVDEIKNSIIKNLTTFLIIFLVGFSISLLYWYKPIFVYHGKTLNNMQDWAFEDFSNPSYQVKYFFNTIVSTFFNFSDVTTFFVSILSLIGIGFLLKEFNKNNLTKFIFLILLTAFIGAFHYFLSEPLLGTHFSAPRIAGFTLPIATTLLVLFTISNLFTLIKKENYSKYFVVFLLIVFLMVQSSNFLTKIENDKWFGVGKNPISPDLLAMQSWVINNTNVNDIFLSSNELGFALNALTGRKLLITRRSQNSPFIDFDQREADGAVILYGNNSEKRLELLKEYNIKYLYWNYYWIQSEYSINEKGEFVSWFDPIIVKDTSEYKNYLDNNRVRYTSLNTWLDPAMRGEDYKKLNLLFIIPQYKSLEQPWQDDLNKYLEEVWKYENNNETIAKIYRIGDGSE